MITVFHNVCRVNKPYLPIAAEDLSVQSAWFLVLLFAVAGLLIVGMNFGPFITSLYCLGLFLGTIYSVPPFRLKRFAVIAFLIIGTVCLFLDVFVFFLLLLQQLCINYPYNTSCFSEFFEKFCMCRSTSMEEAICLISRFNKLCGHRIANLNFP